MIMRMKTRLLQPIIKKVLVILPFYLFTFLPLTAQTYTQRIQKTAQGQGTVTIPQDEAIDELANGVATPATPKKDSKPAAKPQNQTPKPQTPTPTPKPQTPAVVVELPEPAAVDSIDNAGSKRTFKTTGYRIQVFAGGNTRRDRQRAEQAGNALRQLYPGEEVYVHFYSPRWICRLGNYRTYEEAHEKMLEIRKMGYESATVVKGKITVTQ
jgi:hypothetical protein